MSSIYNQPQVSHPSLAHRAAGDTGENGHHLEVCRWVKLVKGVIFGQTRDSLKIRGNHYALSYPFWGGVAWPYLDLGRCIYLYIHVTHKQPKIQLEGCSSVASLSLGCISHANTHNIPTTSSWNDEFYSIYQQIDGILLGFSHTFSKHTKSQNFEAFHLRVDHGHHMAPRNPLLEFQDIQRYIAISRWPRWDSKGIDGITVIQR